MCKYSYCSAIQLSSGTGKNKLLCAVYSFAILMYELYVGHPAYEGYISSQARCCHTCIRRLGGSEDHVVSALPVQCHIYLIGMQHKNTVVCMLVGRETHLGSVACAAAAYCRTLLHGIIKPEPRGSGGSFKERAVTRQCALAQVMFMVCVGNARPEVPQGMPPDFLQLLTDCWCAPPWQAPAQALHA